mgnify:CR=1 FL=1
MFFLAMCCKNFKARRGISSAAPLYNIVAEQYIISKPPAIEKVFFCGKEIKACKTALFLHKFCYARRSMQYVFCIDYGKAGGKGTLAVT